MDPISEKENIFSLTDVLMIIIKWKRFIISFNFLVIVASVLMSLFMSKTYTGQSVITLPEKSTTPLDMLTGNMAAGAAMLGLSGTSPQSRYLAILDSRRLKEAIIDSFELQSVYKTEKIDDALRVFDANYHVTNNKLLGTIGISFDTEEEPEKAAQITNFAVAKLDEINRELATENARAVRMFMENRYTMVRKELRSTEDSLNHFQKKFGIIAIPEQTKAAINAAAEIQAQITALETEYNVKKRELGQTHPDLVRLEATINELRKVEKKMEYGGVEMSLFIPFKNTPDLALEYLRLYREVQLQTKILEFLVPQYEQAKLQEAKDTPTILVIDHAKIPLKHSRPKKKFVVLIGMLLGLLTTAVFITIREYYNYLKQNSQIEKNQKIVFFVENFKIKNWFKKL